MLEVFAMQNAPSHLQAAGLALVGYTLWVLCDVCLKFAGASALPRFEVIALVGAAAATLMVLYAAVRGEFRTLWPQRTLPQAARAMLDMGNNICVLIALQHMPLAMFYILIFLSPLVAAVLAHVWLRERLTARQIAALLVGFAGVAIAVGPFGTAQEADWTGYAACLVCVACFSANMVWSRRMTQTESAGSMTFFSGLVITAVAGACAASHLQSVSLRMAAVIGAVAVFGVLGNVCFFFALRYARTAYVSQFHYSQLPTGALIGLVIWRERPTWSMFVGAVMIAAAGLYTAASARDTKRTAVLTG